MKRLIRVALVVLAVAFGSVALEGCHWWHPPAPPGLPAPPPVPVPG